MYTFLATILLLVPCAETAPTFHNHPGTLNLNENADSALDLWSGVSATCYPSTNTYFYNVFGIKLFKTGEDQHTVPCETCTLSSNPNSGLFSWSGSTIRKSACSATSCGACASCTACSTSNGCMTGPATYNLIVQCYTTSYDNNDDGTSTFTVNVVEETPTLVISLPDSVNADNSMSSGTVLATASKSSGGPIVEYTKPTAVVNTYSIGTVNMFELNTANGQVYVATNPAVEYDYTYTIRVCIYTRRKESCKTMTISFDGCFQTPNCNSQTDTSSFSDQFPVGGTFLTMTYDQPSDHFPAISSTWQNLNFVIVSSTLNEASLNLYTGVLSSTGNITVWPDYPYSTHTIVVRVSNPGHSCDYSSTCTMSMRVAFTNWPITITSLPTSRNIHEDTDARTLVHSIITYDYNHPDHDNVTCVVITNEEPTLLELTHNGNYNYNSWFIYKKVCQNPNCGHIDANFLCDIGFACLNYDLDNGYTMTIKCSDAYGTDDTETFTLRVTENLPPVFTNTPTTITISADNITYLDNIFSIYYTDSENETLDYNYTTSPSSFAFDSRGNYNDNPANVTVTNVQSDLVDTTFSINFCGRERRNIVCSSFTIEAGCFHTLNCHDQRGNFSDQHAIGETLFTVTYDGTSDSFNTTLQNLSFDIVSSTLDDVAINTTGIISTIGNITVWPDYPYTTHTIVARVNSTGNICSYTASCTMTMDVYFTNWPIRIASLPASASIHEDTDERTLVHSIIVNDDNNPDHDNVTCEVVTNEEPTLLELYHNGEFKSNSWFIYKKVCLYPNCGYIDASFLCDLGFACLNYDLDNEYTITIKCNDAYGSEDTETFTLKVTENQPPVFTNTPTTITINTDNIAHLDNIFSIYYTDAEKEILDYNYTISPITPSLFAFDDRGNYSNNPANVTATIFQWDLVNTTFSVTFCGRERRNIVCSSFTIDIREYCGPTPVCTDDSTTVTDQNAVAGYEVFQITVTGSGYTQLNYVITSEYPDLFSVDSMTGSITIASALSVTNPPNPSTYSLVANVHDTVACAVAACAFSVEVTFTNEDISITNMASVSVDIHEDTTESVKIVTIATSDANTNDGVTCEVDEAASTPVNNSIFFAVETDTGSNVYELMSKEGPGFDYDVADTYKIVVVCEDNYGSSDTATATVSILENQIPTMDNINAGDIINVDPMTVKSGATIFTLQTSDAENDPLVYTCNVTDSFVPLQCLSDGVVSMKRDVRIPDEEGEMYPITLCIEESVHSHVVCETLNVNISSSKTNPQLNNLPATISFAENTAADTALFTVTVEDPDALDVHTYSMTVYPKTASAAFSLDANAGTLTLSEALDYETLNHYEFLFSVRDVYLPGLEEKYLNLSVTDVNEAPVLTLLQTTYDTIEQSAGYTVATLQYSCTDVDNGQTMTISLSSGTYIAYFTLDPATGIITYAQDWDFENGVVPPQTTSLEITCDDGNGLSSTGNIVINIALVNEFSPVLSTTSEDIIIYSNQTLIDPLFTVTATDSDFGDDGVFEYSILGVGKGSKYFTISSAGSLFISNYIDWRYNATFEFTVRVSDGENDPKYAHVNVNVTYLTSFEIPIPTKEKAKCILCTNIGVTVVSILCVEGFLCLLFFIQICVRMRAYEICQLNPKPKLTTVTDMKRAINKTIKENTDPYRPGSEMMNRALPDERPPSPFTYNAPPRVTVEPPPAAEYIPLEATINLNNVSDPSKPNSRKRKLNSTSITNKATKVNNAPSLFQNNSLATNAMNLPWGTNETNKYEFTTGDAMLSRPAIAAIDAERFSPLFSRPDDSKLYSDDSKYVRDIGAPVTAMDF
ncbi:uncharacterized protein LOC132744737 isoform X2 [Ruditapes philippinarum]|uniref:uncharacterized protein LOC132744737 isoform X2 n=1 Tax=Ruditapes philippinarum TaxID=129788 RepID=UPI00295C1838|nr:uncharacterized protein LOC132744737 isoform X2 [Ruditapes philippinarum]